MTTVATKLDMIVNVGATRRLYIYSLVITEDIMPIGCRVFACCQRTGLLSSTA